MQAFWLRNGDDYGPYEYVGKLVDKRLALMQGFQYSTKILNAGFPVIEWVPSEEVAGKMIMKDRLDLVFADVVVMQQAIRDHSLDLYATMFLLTIQVKLRKSPLMSKSSVMLALKKSAEYIVNVDIEFQQESTIALVFVILSF